MNASVVLITGDLTRIGRASASAFAKDGAPIAVPGRRDEIGHRLVAELRATGAEAEYCRADVGLAKTLVLSGSRDGLEIARIEVRIGTTQRMFPIHPSDRRLMQLSSAPGRASAQSAASSIHR